MCIESPVSGPWISQWMRKCSVTRDRLNYVAVSGSDRYRKHGAWKGNLIFNTFYLQQIKISRCNRLQVNWGPFTIFITTWNQTAV